MIKNKSPKFSIIISLTRIQEFLTNDLNKFYKLKYNNYEIILVTEKNSKIGKINLPVKIIKSDKEKISLGEKRDLGISGSKGEFCAFTDDDAYPDPNWLQSALNNFSSDEKIGAVGGPNITPPEDSFWAKVSGYIYESYLTSGEAQFRYLPKKRREVPELQGVNLIIKREILEEIGGFKSRLNYGDDTKVCNNIIQMKYKIVYDPLVKVYHHRRNSLIQHLKQIRNMGTHRGFFSKAYPQTLSPIYFLPSSLTLVFFIGTTLSFFNEEFRITFLSLFLLVFLLAFLSIVKRAGVIKSLFVSIGIILTHMTYGIFFIRGFLKRSVDV